MTTESAQTPPTSTTPPTSRGRNRTRALRALAVLGAVAMAHAVWAVAVPLAGAELTVRMNGESRQIGPGAILAASLLAGLAAWALLATLERFTGRPERTWTITAVAVLALSLTGPPANGAGAATVIALTAMHLVVGAAIIPTMRRSNCPC